MFDNDNTPYYANDQIHNDDYQKSNIMSSKGDCCESVKY